MDLSNNILRRFEEITQYPLKRYLDDFNSFINNDYPLLLDFFSGKSQSISSKSLQSLSSIINDSKSIQAIIKLNKDKFSNTQYWDLYVGLDDINVKLMTIKKLSKYLRSTITSYNFSQTISFNKTLNYNQDIEGLVKQEFNQNNERIARQVALQNDILEGDWDINGGRSITLTKENETFLSQVSSIVDNPTNESILGKDLPIQFSFEDDDIKVLSYKDTLDQTIIILSQLKKGDIPLDPEKGMDVNIGPGGTLGILTIKSIIRQLQENFATDDLFNGIFVDDIQYIEGDLHIRYTVNIKLNSPISKNTIL